MKRNPEPQTSVIWCQGSGDFTHVGANCSETAAEINTGMAEGPLSPGKG